MLFASLPPPPPSDKSSMQFSAISKPRWSIALTDTYKEQVHLLIHLIIWKIGTYASKVSVVEALCYISAGNGFPQ